VERSHKKQYRAVWEGVGEGRVKPLDLRVPREIMMFHFVPSVLKTLEIHHSTLQRVGDNLFNKQYLQKEACLFEIEQADVCWHILILTKQSAKR